MSSLWHSLRPLVFQLDPERAHRWAIALGQQVHRTPWQQRWCEQQFGYRSDRLGQNLWGLRFPNPLGLAAGFDKNGEAIGAWPHFGFGFVEIGTITAEGQPGQPRPRLFRLVEDRAIVNRMGFNNAGARAIAQRLQAHPPAVGVPLGINLGKSKNTPLGQAAADYATSFELLAPFAQFITINVSSPNTPNLRDLQAVSALHELLSTLQALNKRHIPLLVKIAPDLADDDLRAITDLCLAQQVAGMIATNTTLSRQGLRHSTTEPGGLSGQPLKSRSTAVIRLLHHHAPQLPIIGVGGIASAADAWEKITAGASLLQLYTGWIYEGPWLIPQILRGLEAYLDQYGLQTLTEAIGLAP